ncbi:MAG: hypothetical protein KAV87_17865, partial [Desulfobacteraceae bacterium]|nr:hypothetical protein [Desulfobacteraceae bacterium]
RARAGRLNPWVEWEIEQDNLIERCLVLDSETDYSIVVLVYIPEYHLPLQNRLTVQRFVYLICVFLSS